MRCLPIVFFVCMQLAPLAGSMSNISLFVESTAGSQESLIDFHCAGQQRRRSKGHFQMAVNRWRAEFNYCLPHILSRFPSEREGNFIYITSLTRTVCRHNTFLFSFFAFYLSPALTQAPAEQRRLPTNLYTALNPQALFVVF